MRLSLEFEFHHSPIIAALIPGLALQLNHSDFFMNQQLLKVMERYNKLLRKLRHSFRHTLATRKDFERSVKQNEDGFFLTLYKLISEA